MRAYTDEQVEQMVQAAGDEVSRRVILELRRLYAAEDARSVKDEALAALLSSAHQQFHAAARTFESALRMMQPPQPPAPPAAPPQRRMPSVMMDEQLEEGT